MQVNNNVSAFIVWRNYTYNLGQYRDALVKLAEGRRIIHAGDDPAGLAMSARLNLQYRNSMAATQNVENKINYLQTSNAWMQRITDMISRMAELAVLGSDGTKSATEHENIQAEFVQMQKEIRRITTGATAAGKFNGLYLFRGGNGVPLMTQDGVETGVGSVRLQVGPDGNQVFDETAINLTASNYAIIGSYNSYSYGTINMTLLGSTFATVKWASLISGQLLSISTQTLAQAAVDKLNLGVDYISSKLAILGAEQNRMKQTLYGLQNYAENVLAAGSRIRDVDVATETTRLAKFSVLTQIDTALLAQCNLMPSTVLTLISRL